MDAGRNMANEKNRKAESIQRQVDEATDESVIQEVGKHMLKNGASRNETKAFQKACHSHGLEFDRRSGKLKPRAQPKESAPTR